MARSLPANAFPAPQPESLRAPDSAWTEQAAPPAPAPSVFDRYADAPAAELVPRSKLGGAGGAPYLTFLSSRGENGADRLEAMRALGIGEGAPALCVGGEFFAAAGLAFLLIEHFEFWAISPKAKVGGEWAITNLSATPRDSKADFAAGYRGFAQTLMLWVPGADGGDLPPALAPVGVTVQLLRRQHARLVPQHLVGVDRAATERFLAQHPHLAKFPPKFRVASRITTSVRQTANGDMISSKATPQTLQIGQAKCLSAASKSPEWAARFEELRQIHEDHVAQIQAAIRSGENYAG